MSEEREGVDLKLGDRCSRVAYEWAKRTFGNRPEGPGNPVLEAEGSFSNLTDYGEVKLAIASDGIGTKAELAERLGRYDTLGFDLVAMVADDLVANGFEPVNISNILDASTLDEQVVDGLMKGLHDAAGECRLIVTGGEIAELGSRVGGWGEGMHFNWCATATGILPKGRSAIDGSRIGEGDVVIALASSGFRCNGFTLVRSIMRRVFGKDWHSRPYDRHHNWAEVLLTPSRIYTPAVLDLLAAGMDVRGIAHVTGGGVPGNLGRVLSGSGLGANLDSLFEPQPFMRELYYNGGMSRREAYAQWNMGNGMLLIVPEDAADSCVAALAGTGHEARIAGNIIPEQAVFVGGRDREEWQERFELG